MFRSALLILLAFAAMSAASAAAVRTDHAEAELVVDVVSVAPGDTLRAALRLEPDPGWYVYWINPGDAGLPPTLEWSLPQGWRAGPLEFPVPRRIETPPFASFGYKEEVWYPVRVVAPSGDFAGAPATLRARAEWLICAEECLPESAELSVTVGTGTTVPDAARAAEWDAALARLPAPAPDRGWRARYGESSLELSWDGGETSADDAVFFFPEAQGVIAHAAPQSLRLENGRAFLLMDRDPVLLARPDTLRGVLAFGDGRAVALAVDAREPPPESPAGSGPLLPLLIGLAVLLGIVLVGVMKKPHLQRNTK